MIWDSVPWKNDLARFAKALDKRKAQLRWTQVSSARLEQEFFFSAFAIRKLIEAKKLSDEVLKVTIKANEHKPVGRLVDLMNWHKIDKLYDLERHTTRHFLLEAYCNQIIHSFIFIPVLQENAEGLMGIYVSSDREKGKGLFYFDLEDIKKMLEYVASDDIGYGEMFRSSSTNEIMIIHQKRIVE